jgi:hypothetical protein
MSVAVKSGSAIPFERFWRWLGEHPNCIVRAGTLDCELYDHETLHWHLDEDADRNPLVQVLSGKVLVGEMGLDIRDLLFVQATPDTEGDPPGQYLFELIGGSQEAPYALYHFHMAHGFEQESGHPGTLKH